MSNEQSQKYLKHILNFHSYKVGLDNLWEQSRSQSRELDNVESFDRVVLCKEPEEVDGAMRQPSLHGGVAHSIVELYEVANVAKPVFDLWLESIAAQNPSVTLKLATLKSRERALEKSTNEYGKRESGPAISWLFDIVRATFICDSENDIFAVLETVRNDPSVDIVRLKNRFKTPTPAGFRDLLLNIRIRLGNDGIDHMCELQIHHTAILKYGKEHGAHSHYEFFREYFRGSTESMAKRIELAEAMGSYDPNTSLDDIVSDLIRGGDVVRMEAFVELAELLGELDAAVLARRQILTITEASGKEDFVAASLNNLAVSLKTQGKYAEAEPLYRESLAIRRKVYGDGNPYVAESLNNLAVLLKTQGKYAEAEPLYRESLAIRRKVYGDDHPDVAQTLNGLAILLSDQGKYAEAEPLYRESLAIRHKVYGDDHPDVAQTLNGLANLLQTQGKYAEAEPLYRESLAIRHKVYGDGHPHVADSLNNLAILLCGQGKYAEAEPLYRESLTIRRKVYGDDHPDVATSLNNLAILLRDQWNYVKAQPLCRESLTIRRKVYGDDHPDVN